MERIEQANKLEALLMTTERTFTEFGKLLDEEKRSAVRSGLESAKQALETEDMIRIRESLTELKVASNLLTEVILSGSQ